MNTSKKKVTLNDENFDNKLIVTKKKSNAGRPTVITPEVLRKLEEAFALGCTDLEACFYADISKTTLYDYQQLNPGFVERKEMLKHSPIFLARQTVVNDLKFNSDLALKFLERKLKSEFSLRQEVTGENGGAVKIYTEPPTELFPKPKE